MNHHSDVLVVGAGPAGLCAAMAAATQGVEVMLVDHQSAPGGELLAKGSSALIDGKPALEWVSETFNALQAMPNVTVLLNTLVNGCHDHNFLTAVELRHDHLPASERDAGPRQRMHKVRASELVLATGAQERPLVFANNDVPGCFTAGAIVTYVRQFAVAPGEHLVVCTNNDSGYEAALAWQEAGRNVVAIVDPPHEVSGAAHDAAVAAGLTIHSGQAVIEAHGSRRVDGVSIAPVDKGCTMVTGESRVVMCDTLATSGGFSPVVHLASHTGSRPVWNQDALGFVPGETDEARHFCGSVTGEHALSDCLASGVSAGESAAAAWKHSSEVTTETTGTFAAPATDSVAETATQALFLVPHTSTPTRAPKQFVDLQNDVTAAAIQTATREGFENIEHVKRYTALGFGTDQGKTGNINGLAIVAKALGKSIEETGTTTFRPNYAPVSFGAVAGAQRRECQATRTSVGILDASTLGKIDIQGADAREFLGRVYTNAWQKLAPGRCRYGLMCGEDGMVFDDGVTACLADNHFHMTTTSGGAARVLEWLEIYHQTDWPELDVYFNSVTDHWSTMTISGPNSRKLLSKVCSDIDLSSDAFGFMDWKSGTVAGVPARVFRISFTGELSYEINVPAHYGLHVWETLLDEGEAFDITPYGTETMHVLRAEKGFIIVGQDTDGSVTPMDLDHGWAVVNSKPFSFIGKRGMAREDCVRDNRKQLVGLKTKDPTVVLPEGAQAVALGEELEPPVPMIGHVTSSYHSMALDRSVALALIKGGIDRYGETIAFPLRDNRIVHAEICSPVFYDPNNDAQKV